jgi:two-component system chemotaxis response regulator CheB
MFSTLTERGASATLDALARGASDYVSKPSNVGGIAEGMERVRSELVPKVKALCARVLDRDAARLPRTRPLPGTNPAAAGIARSATAASALARPIRQLGGPVAGVPAAPRRAGGPVEILAIGVSTGGPSALAELLPTLPATLPVPVVIVQHMPPVFTALLSQRLDTLGPLHVVEAEAGMLLEPGTVYLAPGGDRHTQVRRDASGVRIALVDSPPEHSCRPAVDVLFRSVTAVYGGAALVVVLTGMGQDGSGAAPALHAAGSRIVIQDEATSVVWGMPGAIARAGLADEVLPLAAIGPAVVRHIRSHRRVAPRPIAATLTGR